MKDASDAQPQEQLYVAAQRPHRRPLTQDPRCWRPLNITASCGRTVWPACHAHCLCWSLRPNTSAVRAPVGPRILHATPSLRSFVQLRARGKAEKKAVARGVADGHEPGALIRWPSANALQCFQVFRAFVLPLPASAQSLALHPPAFTAGGQSVVPSEDSSHAPPC
jgi:hypothetical protein